MRGKGTASKHVSFFSTVGIPRVNKASPSSRNELQSLHIFRNPTPETDPLLGISWTPVTKTELHYLNIDKGLTMQKDLAKDRVAFWEELQSTL
jgi:hypothetical protein